MFLVVGIYQDGWAQPNINDPTLKIEKYVDGLSSPTGMQFIGTNILVIEKGGIVRSISNGALQDSPVLTVRVQDNNERGLLGIAGLDNQIFLYFTELLDDDSIKNRVYKYEWDGQNLNEKSLILDLPGLPGPNHDGGRLLVDKNIGGLSNLFAVIGDLNHNGVLQNLKNGNQPDDTGVIFRVNPEDGSAIDDNPFANDPSTSKYFAYGIRNSFGMAIDPISGTLWNTENGPSQYDELNVVKKGFNSGWEVVMGPISQAGKDENDLHQFHGSYYADPALSWLETPAITAIEFLNSTMLGESYRNNMFVGDFNFGNLYKFVLNEQRDGLYLEEFGDGLADKVVNNEEELSAITFGSGFGRITDIKTGPDGFVYILSFSEGAIYRISPM
jgi:glucose/arabinose dehydrogenase